MDNSEYQPDKYQAMALKTWYSPDDPRYLHPRHPLIKLAGEAGEVLDLYGKHEYKPGFSWWNCKCGHTRSQHTVYQITDNPVKAVCIPDGAECKCNLYRPLVLDELGDWWYYIRILTFQKCVSVAEWVEEVKPSKNPEDILGYLSYLNLQCARTLRDFQRINAYPSEMDLWDCTVSFVRLLQLLDCPIDSVTTLNYAKLNSEPTAHGWKAE